MPRKVLIRSYQLPYHVYNRTLERKFYPMEMAKLWKIYMDACCSISWCYGARIQSFVLMSNHYHLLLTTPEGNLDDCMCYFQSHVSREVKKAVETKEFHFETPYRWSIIKNAYHFQTVFKYVYQNPLHAGLCYKLEEYEWSTLSGITGHSILSCPIYPQDIFDGIIPSPQDENFIEWISELQKPNLQEHIQKALRRKEFRLPERVHLTR